MTQMTVALTLPHGTNIKNMEYYTLFLQVTCNQLVQFLL